MHRQNLQAIYDEIRQKFQKSGIDLAAYTSISYGIQFTVSLNNQSGLIRIYQNKKGQVKYDFSQIKDPLLQQSLQQVAGLSAEKKADPIKQMPIIGLPTIGTDESGKGDYFGPLVAAGVYVDENTSRLLDFEGIRDSKKLSDKRNLELAKKIMSICNGKFSIIEISPEKYNNLYEQFIREKKNLNTLLAWGHAKAIEDLLAKVQCETAVADQFADERFIQSKLQEKGKRLNLIQMHKAEQNIAVAAASILARARFLDKLSKLSLEYKIDLPKGVSASVVNTAKRIVKEHGKEKLRKVAKIHFKTTKKVLSS
ncbi:MAG: ribonuclease HIII [Thermodesulfovibrionia bacterium]|nr:ribonuclease HIII [Thermodesulfovibrionia bacterium]